MESQPQAQFDPPCPFCGHGAGAPNTVAIHRNQRTITYVCHACEQTWTAIDHVQSTSLFGEEPTQLKLI